MHIYMHGTYAFTVLCLSVSLSVSVPVYLSVRVCTHACVMGVKSVVCGALCAEEHICICTHRGDRYVYSDAHTHTHVHIHTYKHTHRRTRRRGSRYGE